MLDLSGIFPPVPTPFNEDESILPEEFRANLTKWDKYSFRGIVVLGSNGEFPFLSIEEKLLLLNLAKPIIASNKLLIAGAGCEGTNLTISLCQMFKNAGADAILVHTPHFYRNRMTDEALVHHFTRVADNSPLPVILYNVPSNTGLDLNADTVLKLASHENIIGLKDSGGDVEKIKKVLKATERHKFQILAGSANFLYDFLSCGAVGGVCAIANILSKETIKMVELAATGHQNEAKALQTKLAAPNVAVTRKYGVPALKHMLDKFGYYGGPPRSPLIQLAAEEKAFVENEFKSAGFNW